MPIYEWQCEGCGGCQEVFFKIAERPDYLPEPCPTCGGPMRFAISCPMVQCDELVNSPWVRDFARAHNRQDGKRNRAGGPPIESRTDYKNYLKDRDLRPCRGENLSEV